jgi:hypothetical protein
MTTGIAGLNLVIPYGSSRGLAVNVRMQMRGDLEVIRDLRSRVQHSWQIPWSRLSRTNRTDLDAHFAAMRGRKTTFTFVDPWESLQLGYEIAYTVRYGGDSLVTSESAASRWGGSIELVEVDDFKPFPTATMVFPALLYGNVVQLPYQLTRYYRTELGATEDLYEYSYEDFALAAGLQRWSVGGDLLSDAEAKTLLDFWSACGGPYRSFSFTEPETSVAYAHAHFAEKTISHQLNEYNSNSIRATAEYLRA